MFMKIALERVFSTTLNLRCTRITKIRLSLIQISTSSCRKSSPWPRPPLPPLIHKVWSIPKQHRRQARPAGASGSAPSTPSLLYRLATEVLPIPQSEFTQPLPDQTDRLRSASSQQGGSRDADFKLPATALGRSGLLKIISLISSAALTF